MKPRHVSALSKFRVLKCCSAPHLCVRIVLFGYLEERGVVAAVLVHPLLRQRRVVEEARGSVH